MTKSRGNCRRRCRCGGASAAAAVALSQALCQ